MTSGLVKLAGSRTVDPATAWRSLNGREQLALIRGGTMLGTITTLATASAALSANSRGMSIADAVQDSLDPRSKYFMSVQMGNGVSIPIGGPMRSFLKGIAPAPGEVVPGTRLGQWAFGKLNSPISGALNLFRNEDYRGQPIRTGSFGNQLLQTLQYGAEQVAPTSIGAASADLRAGTNLTDTGVDVAGQLLGSNPTLASPMEELNQVARVYPGSNGKDFYDLEPFQQDAIKKLHPELWAQKMANAQDSTRMAQETKDRLVQQQQAADAQLMAGKLSPSDWTDQRTARLNQLKGAESIIYQTKQAQAPADRSKLEEFIAGGSTPRDRYFRAIDAYADPGTGQPDWQAVDEWQARQPQADQDYIARNTGLGGTPVEKLRRTLSQQYYGMPEYTAEINGHKLTSADSSEVNDLLVLVHANTKTIPGHQAPPEFYLATLQKLAAQGKVEKGSIAYLAAQRQILGMLPANPDRDKFRREHPEVALLSGQAPLTPDQIAAVQQRLGSGNGGNIDTANLPAVTNPDGSVSTVRTISINVDGREVLIPTVVNGRVVSNAEAIQEYRRTGRNFGSFPDVASADAAAEKLHQSEAARVGR